MFKKHKIIYLNPYCVQATIVALRNYIQTYTRLLFAIRKHAISISGKSFLHLQWHTFNRKGLTSKTNFNYTKLYEVITVKERETSPALIDKMADKTCDSSSPVWNRQTLGSPHKNGSFGFTVQAAVRFFSVKLSLLYFLHWCFFCHSKGNLPCRKQLIVPLWWKTCTRRLGSK